MSLNKNKVLKFLAFLGLFFYISILKLHNYDRLPEAVHGEELLYAWSGQYLIETGTPVSWSTLNYPKKNEVFRGIVGEGERLSFPATLWKPWLDEPPLYSLLSGGSAHLLGADRTKVPPSSFIRIPSVIASLATSVGVFLVATQFFGYTIGMLAMMFYGLTPILVFGSRLSVPENMIALAVIFCLGLAKSYLDKPKRWIVVVFGLLAAVLGLMKPTGFFLAPLAIFLTFKKRQWVDSFIIILLTILGAGVFLAYGYHYDWNLFLRIVSVQGQRFPGWNGLGYLLNSPAFDIFHFYDGWYIFCLISALVLAFAKQKSQPLNLLVIFLFYWICVALLSGSEGDLLPWYRYTFYPLLSIFGALGIRRVYKSANFPTMVIALGLLLSSRVFLSNAFRPTTPSIVFRLFFLIALLPAIVNMTWGFKWGQKISRLILIGFLGLAVLFNSRFIYSAFEIRCESISCPFDRGTALSEVKLPFLWRFLVLPDSTDMLTTKRPWF